MGLIPNCGSDSGTGVNRGVNRHYGVVVPFSAMLMKYIFALSSVFWLENLQQPKKTVKISVMAKGNQRFPSG